MLKNKKSLIAIIIVFTIILGILYIKVKNEENIVKILELEDTSEMNDEKYEGKFDTGIDYTINNELYSYDTKYEKRGVYFKEADSSYFYYIAMGERNTGGYRVNIVGVNIDNELNVEVIVEETSPDFKTAVTMAFTYPVCMIEFKEKPNSVVIKNTSGEEFKHINLPEKSANDITALSNILINTKANKNIIDGKEKTYTTINKDSNITIQSNEDIYGLYIIYKYSCKIGTLSGNGKSENIGVNNFLHEYIDVNSLIGASKELTLTYNEDVKIADIYVLNEGKLPDFVEVWKPPCGVADLLLFTTHSDDEQLFFLGLLPTYVSRDAYVQVVYFANHNDAPQRLHEQLHGLYTVGIRNYPVMGLIPDAYSTTLEGAISNLKSSGLTEDDALKFQTEMIRRFKPQIVVGHDEKGEYSHGQHILNTYLLKQAIYKANDSSFDEESYEKYGNWQISKLYLHLYQENQITMNYDIPLDYFEGKTAYEVSKEGYSKHLSQQWTWFTSWINGKNNNYEKATDIKTYSPLKYGLFFSTVGEDIEKNDMFENIIYYKEQFEEKESKLQDS